MSSRSARIEPAGAAPSPEARAAAFIREWGDRFRADPLAAGVVTALGDRGKEIWTQAFELLRLESPEYRNSVDEDFTRESETHCGELLALIIAIAAGSVTDEGHDSFEFVRTHAQWRARRQVPLIASLHAYRIAHRIYSEISQNSLSAHRDPQAIIRSLGLLSDFWIQFFDLIGALLAEAHAVEDTLIVASGARSYISIINDLLTGAQPADPESRRLCGLCGIRPGAHLAVAVAIPRSPEVGSPVDREAGLRSFVREFERAPSPTRFGRLVDIRGGQIITIASSDGDTAHNLVRALHNQGFLKRVADGHFPRIGVSLDVTDIARLPQALEEAETAFELSTDDQPIVHFSGIDLQELLVRRAHPAAMRLIPAWARDFDLTQDDELSRTIRAFADCSFNVKLTAQRLRRHTNTVYFRLNRIKKLTGIDPRTYAGTSRLLTIFRLLEIHAPGTPRGDGRGETIGSHPAGSPDATNSANGCDSSQ